MNVELKNAEVVPARMVRIKKITKLIRFLLNGMVAVYLIFAACFLLDLAGFLTHSPGNELIVSPHQTFASPQLRSADLTWTCVRFGFFCFGVKALNQLLSFCAAGQFFTRNNVRCINWIGYLVIGDWVVTKSVHWFTRNALEVSFGQLAMGLLVVLLAWIIDEGRKLQEDQALTV